MIGNSGSESAHSVVARLSCDNRRPTTRSTIEIEYFCYFVSERRGCLTPSRRNVNLDFEKKTFCFCRLGPLDYSPRCISIFADISFRVRYGASLVRSLRTFRVNLYRRTPPTEIPNPVRDTNQAMYRGRGVFDRRDMLDFMHGRSRMTIDPRNPAVPGLSMSGFHRPGRHCLPLARSAVKCPVSRTKGELHHMLLVRRTCIWMTALVN